MSSFAQSKNSTTNRRRYNSNTALPLPAFSFSNSRAPFPVWADSQRTPIKFAPLPKREAVKIFHHARRLERQTRASGREQGCIVRNGKLGLTGLAVLHALLFDFLNYSSGRLDPSYESIARAASVSIRTVARAIGRLKACGILNWVRRCSESYDDRRYILTQETNAYGVAPATQWKFYTPPPEPPAPAPGTWGDHPERPPELAQALEDRRHGLFNGGPLAPLAGAIARLGAARAPSA